MQMFGADELGVKVGTTGCTPAELTLICNDAIGQNVGVKTLFGLPCKMNQRESRQALNIRKSH